MPRLERGFFQDKFLSGVKTLIVGTLLFKALLPKLLSHPSHRAGEALPRYFGAGG